VKAFSLFLFLFLSPAPALAEEVNPWEEISQALYAGEEVVLLPLPSEIGERQEQPPPPQPELHFSGAQVEGTSTAQAMLALPPIYVGGQSAISPYFALKVQSDGTREGQSLSVEGGISLSIGDRGQLQVSIEEVVYPFPQTAYKVDAVFRF
jgi:hypothetical protein